MQKKDSTTNQHKTEAAATSTATPVDQQSLSPPPLQLKANEIIQEKEANSKNQANTPSNYLVVSAAGNSPNDGAATNPNGGNSKPPNKSKILLHFKHPSNKRRQ